MFLSAAFFLKESGNEFLGSCHFFEEVAE